MNTPASDSRRALATKIAIFALGPMLSIVAPLITLPVVTGRFHADGWASIAVGQSIGAAAAIVIELGWGITGPARIARGAQQSRSRDFRRSLIERGLMLLLCVPVIVVVVLASGQRYLLASVLTGLAMATVGLSATWLYVGLARPWLMVFLDSAPRVAASLLGALFIVLGAPLESLPITQLLLFSLAALLPLMFLGAPSARIGPFRLLESIRESWASQGGALTSRLATSSYVALPTTLLALTTGSASTVANYAGIERIARTGLAGLAPVSQALQGWVPAARDAVQLHARMRKALAFNALVAILAAGIFAAVARPVASFLFQGVVEPSWSSIAAFSIVVAAVVMSRCTGIQCLASIGRIWQVAISTGVGLITAVPLILIGGAHFGVDGVAWAIAAAESAVLITQVFFLAAYMREYKRGNAS